MKKAINVCLVILVCSMVAMPIICGLILGLDGIAFSVIYCMIAVFAILILTTTDYFIR